MADERPVIDLNRAMVNMFGPFSERSSGGTLEVVVTLRKPDEFEAIVRENEALRIQNAELRRLHDSMHEAMSENLGLRVRLKAACKALQAAGLPYKPYEP